MRSELGVKGNSIAQGYAGPLRENPSGSKGEGGKEKSIEVCGHITVSPFKYQDRRSPRRREVSNEACRDFPGVRSIRSAAVICCSTVKIRLPKNTSNWTRRRLGW